MINTLILFKNLNEIPNVIKKLVKKGILNSTFKCIYLFNSKTTNLIRPMSIKDNIEIAKFIIPAIIDCCRDNGNHLLPGGIIF